MEAGFSVLLFRSVSHALSAEKILKGGDIQFKLIPVPKQISSDCGVCIRFLSADKNRILGALNDRVDIERVVTM